jgi:lysophospholipase L1-like esterase
LNGRFRPFLTCALVVVAACRHSPTVPDPGPPVITCPGSITVRGVTQNVSFPAPTVTGGTQPMSVSCTPPSGALFEPGSTPVECLAIDITARSQCTFTVTVTPFVLSVTRFLAFGDSFTEGQNGRPGLLGERFVDVPNSYPTKLQLLLNAEYPGQSIVVANRGVGGDKVEVGLRKLSGVLAGERPEALLLLDGYNNLLAECRPRDVAKQGCLREIDRVVATIRDCIHVARTPEYGVQYIFVSTLTPPGPHLSGMDRRIAPEAIAQTNARLSDAVRAEGAILVDPYPLFAGREAEYVDDDGLHLRPAGYQAIADAFFAAIKTSVAASLDSGWGSY